MATRRPASKLASAVKAARKAKAPAPTRTTTTATRSRTGRVKTEPEWKGRKRAAGRAGGRLAQRYDRVDSPLRGPRQVEGFWFMPPEAGGTRWWIPEGKEPRVIKGYLYKPGRWWPHTTKERPGLVDENGNKYAPYGTPMSSAIPDEVAEAAHFHKWSRIKTDTNRHRKLSILDRILGRTEEPPVRGATTRKVKPPRWW